MSERATGRLLVATPLTGGDFERAVVLVLHHDDEGAHGLVLNEPLEARVDAVLPQWQDFVTAPGVLFRGGPVGMDTAMGLVSLPGHEGDAPLGTRLLFGGIGLVDLDAPAPLVVPENKRVNGYPLLLDNRAMDFLLAQPDFAAAEKEIHQGKLPLESVHVEDMGILLRGEDMTSKKTLIQRHSEQLSRPVMDVAIHAGTLLYDPRLSDLLHLVEYTRSVQDACSMMQMSYSSAWNMLNHAEDELGFPLVMRNRGGASGNGTVLTEKGKRLMDAYDQFAERMKKEAGQLYGGYFSDSMNPI